MTLHTRWVDHAAEVPGALWALCFGAPHEGDWWYGALERSGLDDQFRFRYLLLLDGDVVVGMAPTFLMDVPMQLVVPPELLPLVRTLGHVLPWLRAQRTLFVGSPCGEEGRLGLRPGVDRVAAVRAVDAALRLEMRRSGAAFRVWKDCPGDLSGALATLAPEAGLFRAVSFPGTVVDLPAGTPEDYFLTLRRKQRHLIRKKLRRSEELVSLDTEVVRRPDPATLDALFALFWQTYEKATTRFERLNRVFFDRIAEAAPTSFIVLRERTHGEPVAFMMCFELEGTLINKFIGIDYTRPRDWLLYFRLWDAAVAHAMSLGARALQSGQTGYGPKIDLGHRLVALTNWCAHRNPLIQAVYAAVAHRIDWETLDPALAAALVAHPELRQPA